MAKQNQIIAIEKGVKARSHSVLSDLYKVVQKPALFEGMVRTFTPKNDEGDRYPTERKPVQARISDVLEHLRTAMSELVDVETQKDRANMRAEAPVLVNGQEVLPSMPVTTLLLLEKQLTDLRTLVSHLPVLDSAEEWQSDPHSGLFVTDAVETRSTKKTAVPIVLYAATEHHPAQTQLINEDVVVGSWKTVRQSAAMPRPEKEQLAARLEALIIGVKEAREKANDIDAGERPKVGAAIFSYLLQ